MITVKSTINLANQSVPNVIPVVQGDTGRSILFSLADFTIPAGATARYFITKPSGLAIYNDATIDGNTVLVDLTAQSLAEYGDCPGQVRISVGDTVVTSFEFILHVEPFRGIDAVESTTETNIFDKAVEDAREAIAEAAEEAEEYISQALDTTLTIPDKAADAKATGDAISASADEVIAQMRAEIANVYPTETAQGNPASFDDGADGIPVKDLKVEIVPQQDLHGYDAPWPAGGGKNKLRSIPVGSGSANGIDYIVNADGTVKLNGTATGNFSLYIIGSDASTYGDIGIPTGEYKMTNGPGSSALFCIDNTGTSVNVNAGGEKTVNIDSSKTYRVFIRVSTGSTVTNEIVYPMIRPSSVSDATYAPYSNLCPITGTDSVEVVRTGKNLLPLPAAETVNGVTLTRNSDGTITLTGTASAVTYFDFDTDFDSTLYAGYILSGFPDGYSGGTSAISFRVSPSGDRTSLQDITSNGTAITDNGQHRRLSIRIANSYAVPTGGLTFSPMIRKSTDPSGFAPYSKQTVATDLGQTVYGGTLDVTSGVMVIGKGKVTLNGSESWSKSSSYDGSYYLSNWASNHSIIRSTDHMQSNLKTAESISEYTAYSCYFDYSLNIRVDSALVTSVAEFKAWLSENPVDLVYPLKEPITVQLTPQELTTILGTNNITTDAESVDVEYRADIKLYIEQLTEPDADMIADMNITSGNYFMVGNALYLATANIANGADIVPGVNCTRTSLAEALNTINA